MKLNDALLFGELRLAIILKTKLPVLAGYYRSGPTDIFPNLLEMVIINFDRPGPPCNIYSR